MVALAILSPVFIHLPALKSSLVTTSISSLLPADAVSAGIAGLGIGVESYQVLRVARILLPASIFILVGGILYWRKPDEWVTFFFSLVLVGMGALLVLDLAPPPESPSPWVSLLGNGLFAAFFFSFYIFPDGRFVPRWTRWMTLAWLGNTGLISFLPGSAMDPNTWPPFVSIPLYLLLFLSSPAALIYRYRRKADAVQRQQIKWVVFGLSLLVVAFLAFWLPMSLVSSLANAEKAIAIYDIVGGSLLLGAYALVPLSIGFALLRYRLWDIDPLLNRTLVYTALTGITVTIYILLVGSLGTALNARNNPLFAFIATGIVAVLFQPLRERLQRAVNRLMYGERDDPYAVISRLGQRLESSLTSEAVLPTLVETVQGALKLPYVAITLEQAGEFVAAASTGKPVEATLNLPLVYQNETIGELRLAPRSAGEPFSPLDRRLLDDLARQAGVAAHALRLTAELQHARQRLVVTREEERRRLRRDLHDGLGPHLASQMLTISAARQLLHQDPEAADQLLAQAIKHAQTAVSDIRRVVYELRPPALDDLGLVGALRAQVKEYEQGSLQISLQTPETLPPLPAAVEVACYRIAQEALTNVVQHANAGHCSLILTLDKILRLEVIDDGCGIPADPGGGVGLHSMRERAAEIGGTCLLEPMPGGGTRLVAELPLSSDL